MDSAAAVPMLLTVDDLARLLGCSRRHVWRLRDAGDLPAPIRLGKLVRWNREAVLRWINESTERRR